MATFETITTEPQRIKYVIGELKFLPLDTDAGSKLDQGQGRIHVEMLGRKVDENDQPMTNVDGDFEYIKAPKQIGGDVFTEITDPTNAFEIDGKIVSGADVLEWFVRWTDKKLQTP